MDTSLSLLVSMAFPQRLSTLRKARGLTQRALAELVDLSLIQIHRYEAGTAQPSLEGIRKLARALRVSADALVFEQDERGPDEALRLQFEALTQFTPEEKHAAKALLDALILQHQARKWASAS